jgi:integrase
MSLDEFGKTFSDEQISKYGRKMLAQYGVIACESAEMLESTGLSSGTLSNYKSQVRQVIGELKTDHPTPGSVVDVIQSSDKKHATKHVMGEAMKKYYHAIGEHSDAEELKQLMKQPSSDDELVSEQYEVKEWITKEEMLMMENHIFPESGDISKKIGGFSNTFIIDVEHKALCMTLFYTGGRVGEVCKRSGDDIALSVEDLDEENNQIQVYRLKKGTMYDRDYLVVPDKVFSAIHDYLEWKGIEEGPIFNFTTSTAQNRVTEVDSAYKYAIGEYENMDKLTPHKFRHGRVTDIANHSGIEAASEFVGHSSLETTGMYRHLDAEKQKEIIPESMNGDDISIKSVMDSVDVDTEKDLIELLQRLEDEQD